MAIALAVLLTAIPGCELLDPNPGPNVVEGASVNPDVPPADNTPATLERGRTLYAANCARCHGDSAQGSPIWLPPIQGRVGVFDIIRTGRRAMPAFGMLSDSAIVSIELYLKSFPVDFERKTGAELYTIFCSGCHGDSAVGSSVFAGNIQGYHGIQPIVLNGRGDMPAMEIPHEAVESIQRYLNTWTVDTRALSGVQYYARLCAGCHGASGEGTIRGYEIRNPTVDYATHIVRTGRPGTPGFRTAMPRYSTDSLSDRQLTEILTWLRQASKPRSGKLLYQRFCAACHAADGTGGVSQKIVTGKAVDDFDDAIRLGKGQKNFDERTRFMPSWSIQEITDEEIKLMATYARSLR